MSIPKLFNTGDEIEKTAVFSECRHFRYSLLRRWNRDLSPCIFIGLNPSTATETDDDPTIRRCIRFAKDWGHGSLIMLNAYAFRATKPKNMFAGKQFDDSEAVTDDPIGFGNDLAIHKECLRAIETGGIVVAAWGAFCEADRERAVCFHVGKPLHCLGITKGGNPRHPLYMKANTQPVLFEVAS